MQNERMVVNKTMLNEVINQKKLKSYAFGLLACTGFQLTHAAEEQFNDALRNASNPSALVQYRYAMQNDALGYYPLSLSVIHNRQWQKNSLQIMSKKK